MNQNSKESIDCGSKISARVCKVSLQLIDTHNHISRGCFLLNLSHFFFCFFWSNTYLFMANSFDKNIISPSNLLFAFRTFTLICRFSTIPNNVWESTTTLVNTNLLAIHFSTCYNNQVINRIIWIYHLNIIIKSRKKIIDERLNKIF